MIDRAFRLAYRLVYPMAERWWQFRQNHDGVLIAVWVGEHILAVRHSYKTGLHMPGGGIARGEHPATAAVRELQEEVGISIKSTQLRLVCSFASRHGWIHLYEAQIKTMPKLRIDRREIIEAAFLPPESIYVFDPQLAEYLNACRSVA